MPPDSSLKSRRSFSSLLSVGLLPARRMPERSGNLVMGSLGRDVFRFDEPDVRVKREANQASGSEDGNGLLLGDRILGCSPSSL